MLRFKFSDIVGLMILSSAAPQHWVLEHGLQLKQALHTCCTYEKHTHVAGWYAAVCTAATALAARYEMVFKTGLAVQNRVSRTGTGTWAQVDRGRLEALLTPATRQREKFQGTGALFQPITPQPRQAFHWQNGRALGLDRL